VIRIADSFVKINKAGSGNGEASLYLGSKNDPDIFTFFGKENFDIHCIMSKDSVIEYLNNVKIEYQCNRHIYRNEVSLRTWNVNMAEILSLPNDLHFDLTRKRTFDKTGRVYAQELTYTKQKTYSVDNEKAYVYDLIRRIAIPEVSFIMLSKIEGDLFSASLYYNPDF
jgi:hypothetical protein